TIAGFQIAAGSWSFPRLNAPNFRGLEQWTWLGVIPIAATMLAIALIARQRRGGVLLTLSTTAIALVAGMLGFAVSDIDAYKAPRALVAVSGACRRERDIRIASYQYSQPSLVFYCQR